MPLYSVKEEMASTFSTMSTIGYVAAPGGFVTDRKLAVSAQKFSFSSLASISSSSLSGRWHNLHLQKRCNCRIRAMAKELYFNKDGSAIKKLQVSSFFKNKNITRFYL